MNKIQGASVENVTVCDCSKQEMSWESLGSDF